jgi:hypothetical protein
MAKANSIIAACANLPRNRAMSLSKPHSIDGTYCRECGGHMIEVDGLWHHGERGEIWTEDDQDHQPVEDKGFEE